MTMRWLYEVNLLDLPADGCPASISVDPGYVGPIRPVRPFGRHRK